MAKPTDVFAWANTPSSPLVYPTGDFVVGGYPSGYHVPSAEWNATQHRIGEWITYIDPYLGTTTGQLKATTINPYVGTSTAGLTLNAGTSGATVGVTIDGVDNGVKIAVSSAGPTAEHSWEWLKTGRLAVSLTESIDWSTGAIRNSGGTATYASWAAGAGGWAMPSGSTTSANATSGLRNAYPSADRPTITYDVSPWHWPTTVQTSLIALSGADILTGSWQLRNDAGGVADLLAAASLPRTGQISDTAGALRRVTSLAAVGLTKDGTVTEVYIRLRSRTIASWGTTATLASVDSATPTWSGSVVLDETTYVYWLEYFADDANSGSTNGMTVERVTIGIQTYTADV
jgi:hypothetical protein